MPRIIRNLDVARASAAAVALPGRRRSRPGTALGRAVLVLLGVALALLAGEAALRLGRQERHLVWPPGLSKRFHAAPGVMPGVTGGARFRVNSLGLRGDEPPAGGMRVLSLGGSATECLYLDQDEAWPQLRQSRLGPGMWVGNAGRSGLDARHHRVQAALLLDEVPGVEAIIVLAGANDLLRRLARGDGWRPFDPRSAAERDELIAEAFVVNPERRTELPWWARTEVAERVLRHAWRLHGTFAQDSAAIAYEEGRAHRRAAGEVREVLPDLRPALEEHRRNLRAVAAAARRRGSTCAELPGAACFDHAAVVPGDADSFHDDVHFSEAGSRRVARALAPVVAEALRSPSGESPRGAAGGPGR